MWVGFAVAQEWLGWAEIFFFSRGGPNQPSHFIWDGPSSAWPKAKVIICRTWTVVHILHATEMVAKNRGWWRSGSLKAGVSTMIRRLSWLLEWRHYEEWWLESFMRERRRILQKWEREEETTVVPSVEEASWHLG
jgi:hypothetical protein